MSFLIQELAGLLKTVRGVPMRLEANKTQILVTLDLANGRSQTVLISTRDLPGHLGQFVRLQSRACLARDHRFVKSALFANAGMLLGGLALDTSTDPPAVDVIYSLDADQLNLTELLQALVEIAQHADQIEQRNLGSDNF